MKEKKHMERIKTRDYQEKLTEMKRAREIRKAEIAQIKKSTRGEKSNHGTIKTPKKNQADIGCSCTCKALFGCFDVKIFTFPE